MYEANKLSYYNNDNDRTTFEEVWLEIPMICPNCKNSGKQIFLDGTLDLGVHKKFDALSLTSCSYCGTSTVNYYYLKDVNKVETDVYDSKTNGKKEMYGFYVAKTSPKLVIESKIPERVSSKYPRFSEIYYQAEKAEKEDLNELSGMGYRKAVEILITDYLLDFSNSNKDWLVNPKTPLGQKIEKLPPRLLSLSKTVSYLGNDQAHYTKIHNNHDLEDLKYYINAVITEVESELTLREAEEFLNKK